MRFIPALAATTLTVCMLLGVSPAEATATADASLDAAVAGSWRSTEDKARDQYRHPKESLQFWGLQPRMSILEIQPGGGWWTEILAPYAKMTGGEFSATAADLSNPKVSEEAREERTKLEKHFEAHPEVYGKVQLVSWGANSGPLPANRFDFILTARSVHGWIGQGSAQKNFERFYGALKPGGILAVEQHRANPGKTDAKADGRYVTEAQVIELARKAGFELAGRSEINANPKDTKDHPFGVWTLPPTRQSSEDGKQPDAKFDRAKYDAIGESDRMTLRFRKPGAA